MKNAFKKGAAILCAALLLFNLTGCNKEITLPSALAEMTEKREKLKDPPEQSAVIAAVREQFSEPLFIGSRTLCTDGRDLGVDEDTGEKVYHLSIYEQTYCDGDTIYTSGTGKCITKFGRMVQPVKVWKDSQFNCQDWKYSWENMRDMTNLRDMVDSLVDAAEQTDWKCSAYITPGGDLSDELAGRELFSLELPQQEIDYQSAFRVWIDAYMGPDYMITANADVTMYFDVDTLELSYIHMRSAFEEEGEIITDMLLQPSEYDGYKKHIPYKPLDEDMDLILKLLREEWDFG